MRWKSISLSVLMCLIGICASAGQLEMLINDLGGADEAAQLRARQLMPRENPLIAVPKIIPLLYNENAAIWRTAYNILADFANQVAVPGQEAERTAVTGHIMALLAPEQPEAIKIRALKLLPVVIPAGYDLAPIAALLNGDNDVLKEKARATLEETATPEAIQALGAALNASAPPFQAALLLSLSRVGKTGCEDAILALTKSSDATVRAAAGLALAPTGNPAYIAPLVAIWKSSDTQTMFDACDGLLRLADAMARRGGKWDTAMAVYRKVLQEDSNLVQQSGAVAGLGRFGDESVIPDILAALKGINGRELEPAALAAFETLPGVGPAKALLAAYPGMSDEMKLGMLEMFGRKQDAQFLPFLNEAAQSQDPAFRRAALIGLSNAQLAGALDGLTLLAKNAAPDEKPLVLEYLQRMADTFRMQGDKQAAGKAYLALYQQADLPEMRQAALDGVKLFPIAEAFDVLMNSMSQDEIASLSPGVMLGLAKTMKEAGRNDEAKKLSEAVMSRLNNTQAVREVIQAMAPENPGPEMALRFGFVNAWHIAAPFAWDMANAFNVVNINEPNIDPNASYTVGDQTIAWKKIATPALNGAVDLMSAYGALDHKCAYAYAKISVPEDAEAIVCTGSDDGIKVWVNAQPVLENNVDRGMDIDQDQGPAKFKAGENLILVEITQNAGGWNFCLRLTRPDGTVLPFSIVE